jgi:hypothetical protein
MVPVRSTITSFAGAVFAMATLPHVARWTHAMSSTATAVASPPPVHRLAIPRRNPRASSAPSSVAMIRAPLAPMGWPSAHAPPLTLSLSNGIFRLFGSDHADHRKLDGPGSLVPASWEAGERHASIVSEPENGSYQ